MMSRAGNRPVKDGTNPNITEAGTCQGSQLRNLQCHAHSGGTFPIALDRVHLPDIAKVSPVQLEALRTGRRANATACDTPIRSYFVQRAAGKSAQQGRSAVT
jgi:hypothetical protein